MLSCNKKAHQRQLTGFQLTNIYQDMQMEYDMTVIIGQSKAKSISDIFENSTLKKLADARSNFGEDSNEFREALLIHQAESAKQEAEYQARKAANQAWLYEQGY